MYVPSATGQADWTQLTKLVAQKATKKPGRITTKVVTASVKPKSRASLTPAPAPKAPRTRGGLERLRDLALKKSDVPHVTKVAKAPAAPAPSPGSTTPALPGKVSAPLTGRSTTWSPQKRATPPAGPLPGISIPDLAEKAKSNLPLLLIAGGLVLVLLAR